MRPNMPLRRRTATGQALPRGSLPAEVGRMTATATSSIPLRPLGRSGAMVSAIGLGGYHLGLVSTAKEATAIVHAAIDAGVTFMDNAWEYHEGKSEERMGKALAGRRGEV